MTFVQESFALSGRLLADEPGAFDLMRQVVISHMESAELRGARPFTGNMDMLVESNLRVLHQLWAPRLYSTQLFAGPNDVVYFYDGTPTSTQGSIVKKPRSSIPRRYHSAAESASDIAHELDALLWDVLFRQMMECPLKVVYDVTAIFSLAAESYTSTCVITDLRVRPWIVVGRAVADAITERHRTRPPISGTRPDLNDFFESLGMVDGYEVYKSNTLAPDQLIVGHRVPISNSGLLFAPYVLVFPVGNDWLMLATQYAHVWLGSEFTTRARLGKLE